MSKKNRSPKSKTQVEYLDDVVFAVDKLDQAKRGADVGEGIESLHKKAVQAIKFYNSTYGSGDQFNVSLSKIRSLIQYSRSNAKQKAAQEKAQKNEVAKRKTTPNR